MLSKSNTSLPPSTSQNVKERGLFVKFLLGGTATATACLVTNPIEVVKTRHQVLGELNQGAGRVLQSPIKTLFTIARKEGVRGLQGGLVAGMLYQFVMNGARLGFYHPIKDGISKAFGNQSNPAENSVSGLLTAISSGAISGAMGAFAASPFFMMKVRLQTQMKAQIGAAANAQSFEKGENLNRGFQHKYKGSISGLAQVFKEEGMNGLWRGTTAAMLRVAVGSSVQLSSYDYCKQLIISTFNRPDNIYTHFQSSLLAGLLVTTAMNPFDVISTRMYNQPVNARGVGTMYSGILDCALKTVSSEGPLAFYKGWIAHYFRLGPHTILTFVLWEQIKQLATAVGI